MKPSIRIAKARKHTLHDDFIIQISIISILASNYFEQFHKNFHNHRNPLIYNFDSNTG